MNGTLALALDKVIDLVAEDECGKRILKEYPELAQIQ